MSKDDLKKKIQDLIADMLKSGWTVCFTFSFATIMLHIKIPYRVEYRRNETRHNADPV